MQCVILCCRCEGAADVMSDDRKLLVWALLCSWPSVKCDIWDFKWDDPLCVGRACAPGPCHHTRDYLGQQHRPGTCPTLSSLPPWHAWLPSLLPEQLAWVGFGAQLSLKIRCLIPVQPPVLREHIQTITILWKNLKITINVISKPSSVVLKGKIYTFSTIFGPLQDYFSHIESKHASWHLESHLNINR